MRLIFPAFFFSLALGAAAFACSSSDDDKSTKCTADGGCAPADGGDAATNGGDLVVDAGPTDFASGGGDGGTTGGGFDAGTSVTGSDAGTMCLSNSVTEVEDNSVAQAAQQIPGQSGTFCGTIEGQADNDFVRFTLPADAQSLYIHIVSNVGGLGILAQVDGADDEPVTFPFPSQTPTDFVFKPGGTYLFGFSTRTAKPIDYRMELTIY